MKTIETDRLILRQWRLEDLDDLHEYAKNPDVGPMAGWEPHSSKEVSLYVLKSYIENDDRWAIVLRGNEKVIGSLRMHPDENRGKYDAKYFSYDLSADYWGKGYMTEAVKRAVKYAFEELNVDLLTIFFYPHNIRSRRVAEKCGFQYEGILEKAGKRYDGQVFDHVIYSISKVDYYNLNI